MSDADIDKVAADDFADNRDAVQALLIDSHLDEQGRRWLLIEERRLSLVLCTDTDADTLGTAHIGTELLVRLDVMNGRS